MADPICRWRNVSIETLFEFLRVLPKVKMSKESFRAHIESQWPGFTTTPYQLAKMMGLYYEDNASYYPRFSESITFEEAELYLINWAQKYYSPNPYSPSMPKNMAPRLIYHRLKSIINENEGKIAWATALELLFDSTPLGNDDILRNYINNYTDLSIIKTDNQFLLTYKPAIKIKSLVDHLVEESKLNQDDPKLFFDYIGNKITQSILSVSTLKYNNYLIPIRTKPFILLAGISGIGKSRIVRELAFMTCPKLGKLQDDETTPGNYCMIEVKPNWHDSSELLGYVSGIRDKYIVTPFIKFLVKAMRYPKVPFFICLDEMNLAPVEQYFAEYLSVLETRKTSEDKINSGSLINKDIFITYKEKIYEDLGLEKEEFNEDEFAKITEIKNELEKFGLRLPQNVMVIGTVNMDDTTHQFSRKVIDRAMTIEMNHVNFEEMFSNDDMLHYFDEPAPFEQFISDCVRAKTAFEFIPEEAEILKSYTIDVMNILDKQLRDTPFRVAYRVQNELILYFRNMRYIYPEEEFEKLFSQTVDAILNMKVLPRIEGDEDLVEKPLKDFESWCKEKGYQSSLAKINEMLARLERTHYTSYWP